MIITFLLTLVYPLFIAARICNAVLGRDPLRLRRRNDDSLWIERPSQPDSPAYFAETSPAEGHAHGGMGRPAFQLLTWLSLAYSPRRDTPSDKFSAAADREHGIPDELYTLW
jgi:hypothetical protein